MSAIGSKRTDAETKNTPTSGRLFFLMGQLFHEATRTYVETNPTERLEAQRFQQQAEKDGLTVGRL